MTISADQPVNLTGTGPGFDLALESLLRAAIDRISAPPVDASADQSVRFRAEAPTREELVRACLDNIMTQISDLDTHAVAVTLDGIRPIENGYRAWGSLFLVPERDDARLRLSLDSLPTITLESDQCRISVGVSVIREL